MAAPKGHARYGGRKAGTPNKKTQALEEICEKYNFNPFEALVSIAAESGHPIEIRLQALKEVCQYVYPKRKAIEVSASAEGFRVVVEDYTSTEK